MHQNPHTSPYLFFLGDSSTPPTGERNSQSIVAGGVPETYSTTAAHSTSLIFGHSWPLRLAES